MDSIIDQMMTVAEYIGWETKELRPVSLVIGRVRVFNYAVRHVNKRRAVCSQLCWKGKNMIVT